MKVSTFMEFMEARTKVDRMRCIVGGRVWPCVCHNLGATVNKFGDSFCMIAQTIHKNTKFNSPDQLPTLQSLVSLKVAVLMIFILVIGNHPPSRSKPVPFHGPFHLIWPRPWPGATRPSDTWVSDTPITNACQNYVIKMSPTKNKIIEVEVG